MNHFVCIVCFNELKLGEGFNYCKKCEEKIKNENELLSK